MLKALTVQDFALVTALDINFGDGLTVITGESGAGKSILLGALGLVLGERASASVVRPGAGRADVSAEFDLSGFPQALGYLRDQALLDDDDGASSLCLVRRVVTSDGRSRAFINGTPVTLGVLRELCEGLVDIHGQDENQRLGQRAVQLALLDDFGTEPALRRACRDAYRAWQQASQAARDLAEDIERRSDKAALLAYQLEELERLALQPGEFEQIEAEHKRLAQAQTLRERVAEALAALEDDAVTGRVLRLLGSIDDTHPELESAMAALSAASDLQSDAERDLRGYADSLDVDPGHLEDLDARLAAIHELARKHRRSRRRRCTNTPAPCSRSSKRSAPTAPVSKRCLRAPRPSTTPFSATRASCRSSVAPPRGISPVR
ncbi:MAG: AAA family ATPase [Pseudomonadales bacterium]